MSFNNDVWTVANQNQNTAGLSLDHGLGSVDPFAFSIEQMGLPELMLKNHHIRDLHQHWTAATTAAIETTQVNNSLLKEIAELKAEVQRLKANEGCLLPYVQA
jgi:hypothetical protein